MRLSLFILINIIYLFNLNAYADATIEYSMQSLSTDKLIHSVTVKIKGSCCPVIYLSTKVGKIDNGKCKYEKETTPTDYGYCGPSRTYFLNGERLKELVGPDYTCAATHAKLTLSGEGLDEFTLISVDSNYVASMPNAGAIELPFECMY